MDESPLEKDLRFIHDEIISYMNSLHQRETAVSERERLVAEREAVLARREQEIESLNRMFEH